MFVVVRLVEGVAFVKYKFESVFDEFVRVVVVYVEDFLLWPLWFGCFDVGFWCYFVLFLESYGCFVVCYDEVVVWVDELLVCELVFFDFGFLWCKVWFGVL